MLHHVCRDWGEVDCLVLPLPCFEDMSDISLPALRHLSWLPQPFKMIMSCLAMVSINSQHLWMHLIRAQGLVDAQFTYAFSNPDFPDQAKVFCSLDAYMMDDSASRTEGKNKCFKGKAGSESLHVLYFIIVRKFKITEQLMQELSSSCISSHRIHAQPWAIYCQNQFSGAQENGLEGASQTAGFYKRDWNT